MKTGYITYTTKSPYDLPIPRESVDLIVTRIPEPLRHALPGVDSAPTINTASPNKYFKDIAKVVDEMYRVLKPGGTMVIDSGKLHDVNHLFYQEIALKSKFNYLGNLSETLDNTDSNADFFNFDSVRTWHVLSKGLPYFNPFLSKEYFNPILQVEDSEEDKEIADWIVEANEKLLFEIKTSVASRFVEIFAKPNAIVLDPFGSSGSVAIAASKLGRSAISSEPNSDIMEVAKIRAILSMGEKYFNENVKVVPFE
jgi:DNA modification methylase